jgi:uncharacterized protein involved in exopolysaccharide biosynthesis
MEGQELVLQNESRALSFTLRDFVAMGFRRRRVMILSFIGILLGAIVAGLLWPRYMSETEILVRRERVDPVVSPEMGSPMMLTSTISEEEMNSEVELINNNDVIRKAIVDSGFDKQPSMLAKVTDLFGKPDPDKKMAGLVEKVRSHLSVKVVPKTNMIKVAYTSRHPKVAAALLAALDNAYLEKHKDVQRPGGQYKFFDDEVAKAQTDLNAAEGELKAFPKQVGVANPLLARDITVQKLNDFNESLGHTRAAIADGKQRLQMLQDLKKSTPERMTTQLRKEDNAATLQQLQSTLNTLELQRIEMASKYQPDYRPMQELDKKIAQTKSAISGEKPLSDEITDQNPTYTWVDGEIAKTQAELRGQEARATETESIIHQTMARAQKLDEQGIEQQDLLRNAKAAEDNYMLYLRKREESRISDALDESHILNVSIAQAATLPVLPAQPAWMFGLVGIALALTVSAGMAFTMEYLDPSFRTPAEVEAVLNLPVLASVPDQHVLIGTGNGLNGTNGHSR